MNSGHPRAEWRHRLLGGRGHITDEDIQEIKREANPASIIYEIMEDVGVIIAREMRVNFLIVVRPDTDGPGTMAAMNLLSSATVAHRFRVSSTMACPRIVSRNPVPPLHVGRHLDLRAAHRSGIRTPAGHRRPYANSMAR